MGTHSLLKGLAIACLLIATAGAQDYTDAVTKTFKVQPGSTLALSADYGHVELKTGTTNDVEIKVFRRVDTDTKEAAQKIFDDLLLETKQEGTRLEVRGRFQKGWQIRDHGDWDRRGRNICMTRNDKGEDDDWSAKTEYCLAYAEELREMRYIITVPRKMNVEMSTRGGHMELADLDGTVQAKSSGGHIQAGSYTGAVTLRTAGGHIKMGSAGGAAKLNTAGGHIEVRGVNGNLEARTAGGHIDTGAVRGDVIAKTAGGHISIEEATGSINAETVGGSVTARFAGQPKTSSRLKTMAGSVNVELPSDVKLDVDAESSGGSVYTAYPLTAERVGRRNSVLRGQINGGGPKLELRTTHGSIRVNKATL